MNNWKETILGKLPARWDVITASDFCIKVADGTHDSPKQKKDGRCLVTSKHIKNGKVDLSTAYKISEDDFFEVNKRSKVDKWDVLLSMIGTVGEPCLVSDEPEYAIKNVGLFKCGAEHKARWLYLFLKSKTGQNHILSRLSGTTQEYITLGELRDFPIPMPPEEELTPIVEMLTSLDDKIELLRKQNETLEKIAQTIFKRWFVEFEFPFDKDASHLPAEALAKGGYKSSGGKMVESELGEIPEEWRVGVYEDLVEVVTGKGLKKEFIKHKGKFSILGANGELGRTDQFLFNDNLILTGRVGTLGTIYISRGKVWISDNVLISKATNEENFYYAYFNLKRFNFNSLNRGSTQPLITQTDLKNVEIVIPDQTILKEWHFVVSALFNKTYNNNSKIQTLSRLRDTLLPELMSGEVRVK